MSRLSRNDQDNTVAEEIVTVEEIHGDLERPAITIHDVYTELDRPEVGEK
ncbi:unannotated protein [freshwater metagenome]|uniref:Unannotated protein n=1 Tax=freshwater metagenome TaxID=449393 RepID=A0A6J5Z4V9_9ZZZZ|nr:hypothetical protein [Actinomycetota bacterium]